MSHPNQRLMNIKKEKCDKQHLYTTNNLEALEEMVITLDKVGSIKLYLYLAKNQDNYQFELSSKDFCNWAGITKRTYIDAFRDLEDKGYLVKKDEDSNVYFFYDKARKDELDNVTIEHGFNF